MCTLAPIRTRPTGWNCMMMVRTCVVFICVVWRHLLVCMCVCIYYTKAASATASRVKCAHTHTHNQHKRVYTCWHTFNGFNGFVVHFSRLRAHIQTRKTNRFPWVESTVWEGRLSSPKAGVGEWQMFNIDQESESERESEWEVRSTYDVASKSEREGIDV